MDPITNSSAEKKSTSLDRHQEQLLVSGTPTTGSRPLSSLSTTSTIVDIPSPGVLGPCIPDPSSIKPTPTVSVDPENGPGDEKSQESDGPPEGGLQAWLTVLGSFFITTAVYGLSNSVGVIQPYWDQHQLSSYAVRDIAWISGANIFLCLFLGVQVGPWFDRFGPRWLLLAGSIIYTSGLVGLGFLPEKVNPDSLVRNPETMYALLMLLWGVIMGSGAALCCTVALSVLAHWFEKRRGLAAGIVFVGSSLGGAVFPLVLKSTLTRLGWAWSMRILALTVASLLVMGNVLIRGRIKGKKGSGAINFKCFTDAKFAWTTVGVFMNQFILIAGLGMVPTWAIARGFQQELTYTIMAVMSAGSGVGRLAAGAISDKIGRFNTMILTTMFSIVTTFAVWLLVETHRVWLFYVFAALFGFGTGSVISIGPVCVGQLTIPAKFGLYYGTMYAVASLSSLLCIPLSASILEHFGTQVLVIVFGGILVVALGAFSMARLAIQNYKWRWMDVV